MPIKPSWHRLAACYSAARSCTVSLVGDFFYCKPDYYIGMVIIVNAYSNKFSFLNEAPKRIQ